MVADALILAILVQVVFWLHWSENWRIRSCLMWGFVFQFLVPYVVVAALARWGAIPIIRQGLYEVTLTEDDWVWCLFAANVAVTAIAIGYAFVKSLMRTRVAARQLDSITRPTESQVIAVFLVVLGGFIVWALGVSLTHGMREHFAEPLVRRGGASEHGAGFLIPLGAAATTSAGLCLIGCTVTVWGTQASRAAIALCAISLIFAGLILYSAGGRGGVIQFVGIAAITFYGARCRSVPYIVWAFAALGAVLFAVFGSVFFTNRAWDVGIAESLLALMPASTDEVGPSLQKLVTFGQSLLHPLMIRDALERGLQLHYFRDVPSLPLYLVPKFIHGVEYYPLQLEFMDNFPDPGGDASNNIKIVSYLFWGFGWKGVICGGAVAGAVLAMADSWVRYATKQSVMIGSGMAFAISFGAGFFNGGPSELRDSLPMILVIVALQGLLAPSQRLDATATKDAEAHRC